MLACAAGYSLGRIVSNFPGNTSDRHSFISQLQLHTGVCNQGSPGISGFTFHSKIIITFILMLAIICVLTIASFAQQTTSKGGRLANFDHSATGFELTGGHKAATCESCHVGGKLKNTPTKCASCHNNQISKGKSKKHPRTAETCSDCHTTSNWKPSRFDHSQVTGSCASCHNGKIAKGKSSDHIRSTNSCEDCHVSTGWTNVRFDHTAVSGTCSSCHNGRKATGKPAKHIQSSNICEDCHISTSWTNVRVDHSSITGTCVSCHNNRTVSGKPNNHIPTSNVCEDCHVTTSWSNVRFDHASVTGSCSSCHNGRTAKGKPNNHIASTNTCEDCHVTTSWSNVRFDHASVTGSCSSCHNGRIAKGKPNGHFVTTKQCNDCHRTTGWSQITFQHTTGSFPQGHSKNLDCTDCHRGNTVQSAWTTPAYKPDCAGCHANDYERKEHKKYRSPTTVFYRVSELRDCAGACHEYTDATLTTIKKRRSGEHRPGRGGW